MPYGATATYGEIAERIGNPAAPARSGWPTTATRSRSSSPVTGIIGQQRKTVGYAGGVELKERLLALESGSPLLF